MSTIGSRVSEIDAASAAYTREFTTQVIVGIIAAVILAYLAFRVWTAGNKLQDAISANAQARIEEAQAVAADANKKAAEAGEGTAKALSEAATANERAAQLGKEAAQAKLELARLTKAQQPRNIDIDAFTAVLKDKRVFSLSSG